MPDLHPSEVDTPSRLLSRLSRQFSITRPTSRPPHPIRLSHCKEHLGRHHTKGNRGTTKGSSHQSSPDAAPVIPALIPPNCVRVSTNRHLVPAWHFRLISASRPFENLTSSPLKSMLDFSQTFFYPFGRRARGSWPERYESAVLRRRTDQPALAWVIPKPTI